MLKHRASQVYKVAPSIVCEVRFLNLRGSFRTQKEVQDYLKRLNRVSAGQKQ